MNIVHLEFSIRKLVEYQFVTLSTFLKSFDQYLQYEKPEPISPQVKEEPIFYALVDNQKSPHHLILRC
jgi:hypothetical protein